MAITKKANNNKGCQRYREKRKHLLMLGVSAGAVHMESIVETSWEAKSKSIAQPVPPLLIIDSRSLYCTTKTLTHQWFCYCFYFLLNYFMHYILIMFFPPPPLPRSASLSDTPNSRKNTKTNHIPRQALWPT